MRPLKNTANKNMGAARNFLLASSLSMVAGGGVAVVHAAEQGIAKVEGFISDCSDKIDAAGDTYAYSVTTGCTAEDLTIQNSGEDMVFSDGMWNILGSIAIGSGVALLGERLVGRSGSEFPNRNIWAKHHKPLR